MFHIGQITYNVDLSKANEGISWTQVGTKTTFEENLIFPPNPKMPQIN